jgi:hypothetical protein
MNGLRKRQEGIDLASQVLAQSREWTSVQEFIGTVENLSRCAYISDFGLLVDLPLQALKNLRLQQSLGVSRHVWLCSVDMMVLYE